MGGCLWRVLGRDCDPDFKGDGEVNLPHGHRELKVPACGFLGLGWRVKWKGLLYLGRPQGSDKGL